MMNEWKLIDSQNPESWPDKDAEIWICCWQSTENNHGCASSVEPALWSDAQRILVIDKIKHAPKQCYYLWQPRKKPAAPKHVQILKPNKCMCQRDTDSPCGLAYEDDGYCLYNKRSDDTSVRTCRYRKRIKEASCT